MEREKTREMVLQCLHAQEGGASDNELLAWMMAELKVAKSAVRPALQMAKNIAAHMDELDAVLRQVVTDYDWDRVQLVERNILRLALYEMWHLHLPSKVIISEAMRLSRKYATPEAAHFVHAILGDLAKKVEAQREN